MEYGFSSFTINKFPTPFVNELRIGNWISSYMAFMDDKEFSHKEIKKVQVDGELMKYLIDNPLATFKGIPLSSDILEKCGFKIYGKNCWVLGHIKYFVGQLPKGHSGYDTYVQFKFASFGIEVKYLHQMQNIVYVLTGQELKVNL